MNNNIEGMKNAGYTIIHAEYVSSNSGCALAISPNGKEFVTWTFTAANGEACFFWGHYFVLDSICDLRGQAKARREYHQRLVDQLDQYTGQEASA